MNPLVGARAKKLEPYCLQGVDNKAQALTDYFENHHISLRDVTYVVNNINDLDVMKLVNTTFCQSNAHTSIKEISHFILRSKGGEGVSREILYYIDQSLTKV